MKINQNTFIVTGAASGLGFATTSHFLSQGATVIGIDLDTSNEKFTNLQKQFPKNLIPKEMDVTENKEVIQVVRETHKNFGPIGGVINCAGIIIAGFLHSSKKHYELNQEIFQFMMKVNVLGTFYFCQAYAKVALENKYKQGVIINISSISGEDGGPSLVGYSASKGAILGMTMPLARELGKYGLRVISILPGFFPSKMESSMQPKYRNAIIRNSALGRFGTPFEFASLVEGIMKNKYLTGVNLRFNGGTGVPML